MTGRVWLLTSGDYSGYGVVGAFADETQAREVADALNGAETGWPGYRVEDVPVLGDLRVEHLWTWLHLRFWIKWNGETDRRQYAGVEHSEPMRRVRLRGVPDDDDDDDEVYDPVDGRVRGQPGPCDVMIRPYETNYTLGATLDVVGTDLERVRKVFSEKRAQMIANPINYVVAAWAAEAALPTGRGVPAWVWRRPENKSIVPALRSAGL